MEVVVTAGEALELLGPEMAPGGPDRARSSCYSPEPLDPGRSNVISCGSEPT